MDPATISLIVGVAILVLERGFSFINRIRKSTCCGNTVEMREEK